MVLCTSRVLVTLVLLSAPAVLGAGNATADTDLCQYLDSHPAPAKGEYETTIGPWLETKLTQWRTATPNYASSNELGFYNHLVDSYAPNMPNKCTIGQKCELPACSDFSTGNPIEDRVNAYYALASISNLNSGYASRLAADKSAYDLVSPQHMIEKYSDAHNFRTLQKEIRVAQRVGLPAALTLGLGAAPLTGPASDFVGVPGGIDAETVHRASDLYSDAHNLGEHWLNVAGYADVAEGQMAGALAAVQTKLPGMSQKAIQNSAHSVMKGGVDYGNSSIVDFVRTGEYIKPSAVSDQVLHKQMKARLFALYLGLVWRMERTYIVMADAPDGCEGDDRGPDHLKVCLDEYQDFVFYIYFIPRVREGIMHQAYVRGPPGYFNIARDGIDLTLRDVVAASVNNYMNNKRGSRETAYMNTVDELQSVDARDWYSTDAGGGLYAGLFRIPVCRNPDGGAISSINKKESRNYPCMCGENNWLDGKPLWDQAKDETDVFLGQTGLQMSGDWADRCDKQCNKDHKQFRNLVGTVGCGSGLTHPFDKCHTSQHTVKGCENGSENGHNQVNC